MSVWMKILSVHAIDTGLILRVYKELLKINKKKINDSRKMVKSFEDIQMTHDHMKRCSMCH